MARDAGGVRRASATVHHAEPVSRRSGDPGGGERQYPSQTERDGVAPATGCVLWRQLRLEEFWEEKLSEAVKRETVPWAKVLQLLVVNRLIDPGSEFRVHRQWFDQSAMAELLEADFAVAEK